MSRSMSGGLRAHRFEIGRRASMEHLVDIFDPAPTEMVGTIAEQQALYMQWIDTLKFRSGFSSTKTSILSPFCYYWSTSFF